jgi:integrase/recombinase XerD
MVRLSAVPGVAQVDTGDAPGDWADLRASFVLAMRAARRSPTTIKTYAQQCDGYLGWFASQAPGRLVEDSTRDDLRGYLVALEERGLKPNSVATVHRSLRALFKFMASEEIITKNPMASIPTPSITEERIPPALSADQIAAMVKTCKRSTFTGARDRALILLISSSGIRASECIGLTEADLHLDSEQPFVVVRGKGDRYREAACSHEAALAIRNYLRLRRKHAAAHHAELWLSRTGQGMTTSGLLQIVRDAGKRAGLDVPVHTHALRHTATDHMLRRGMSDHNVAQQLGHRSLKMLGRYGRARATERSRDDFFRGSG